jgi:hypothetical protein
MLAFRRSVLPTVRSQFSRTLVNFPNDNKILGDDEQQGGRRKAELDDAKQGLVVFFLIDFSGPVRNFLAISSLLLVNQVTFNRDPIFPPAGAGTKANPIEVRSAQR